MRMLQTSMTATSIRRPAPEGSFIDSPRRKRGRLRPGYSQGQGCAHNCAHVAPASVYSGKAGIHDMRSCPSSLRAEGADQSWSCNSRFMGFGVCSRVRHMDYFHSVIIHDRDRPPQ